jgi:hypothetical protein
MFKSALTLLGAIFLATGCAQSQPGPNISVYVSGQSIPIISKNEAVPQDCTYLSLIQVTDGLVGTGRWRYIGSRERAMLRLRNRGAEMDADLIRVDEELTTANLLKYGFEITLNATAFKCVQDHRLDAPGNPR